MAKTWNILELGITPVETISLCCPSCGTDAEMPIGDTSDNRVIAAFGLNLIFDRPWDAPKTIPLPTTIKCRYCRHIFTSKPERKGRK